MKVRKSDQIETVLSEMPAARCDNRMLVLAVWDREGLNLSTEQWAAVMGLSQPETIRRHACKVKNEQGRFRCGFIGRLRTLCVKP